MVQHTVDWDARYRAGDPPWEDETVAPIVTELVLAHARPGAHVLEIGCGYGTNSLWLAQQGYRVTACDVSPNAVRVVGERAMDARVDVSTMVADALAVVSELPAAEVVFTRGVLHTFMTGHGRARFAAAVASCLLAGSNRFSRLGELPASAFLTRRLWADSESIAQCTRRLTKTSNGR